MTLEEYLKKYRRGSAAITLAEARVAGIPYPPPKGWPKKNRLLAIDEVAMCEALKARRKIVARRKGKETKAEKRTRLALDAAPRSPSVVVSITLTTPAPTEATQYDFINSKAFLASFEWRQLRFKALKKYGRRCQCCGASPESGAVLNVDHVKPRRKFPELALDLNNLQILCEDCNHGKANEIADFRAA